MITVIYGEDKSLWSYYFFKVRNRYPDATVTDADSSSDLEGIFAPSLFDEEEIVYLISPSAEQIKFLEKDSPEVPIIISATKLSAGLKKIADETIQTSGKSYKETGSFLLSDIDYLDSRSKYHIIEHYGVDSRYIVWLLERLESEQVNFDIEQVSFEKVKSYLGPMGGMKPWAITDAIDAGDPGAALMAVHRAVLAGDAVFMLYSIVATHIERMFRLSSSGITDENDAAEFLGVKGSTYPVVKALRTMKRYRGSLPALATLVVNAGVDIQGGTGLAPRTVLEVLVGRLATYPRK